MARSILFALNIAETFAIALILLATLFGFMAHRFELGDAPALNTLRARGRRRLFHFSRWPGAWF